MDIKAKTGCFTKRFTFKLYVFFDSGSSFLIRKLDRMSTLDVFSVQNSRLICIPVYGNMVAPIQT